MSVSEDTDSHDVIARLFNVVSTLVDKHPKSLHTLARVTSACVHQDKDFLTGAALFGMKIVDGSEAWHLL